MISKNELSNANGWGFSAGCKNRFWLVGNVVKIDRDNHCIHLSREEPSKVSEDNSIVAHLRQQDSMPAGIEEGSTIKLVGHLHSGATADMDSAEAAKGMRHLHLKVLGIDRPGLLDSEPDDSLSDDSDDLFGAERFTRASNDFRFSGFVVGRPFEADGRMIVMVGQTNGREHFVPFEVPAQKGMKYRKHLVPGGPVTIRGLVEPRNVTGVGIAPVARVLEFQKCRESDFLFTRIPEWAKEIRKKNARGSSQPAEQAAERA